MAQPPRRPASASASSRVQRQSSSDREATEPGRDLDRERDIKFRYWLQTKAFKERAFEYLGRLDVSRAEERASLREVAVALGAVERALAATEATLNAVLNKVRQHRRSHRIA